MNFPTLEKYARASAAKQRRIANLRTLAVLNVVPAILYGIGILAVQISF